MTMIIWDWFTLEIFAWDKNEVVARHVSPKILRPFFSGRLLIKGRFDNSTSREKSRPYRLTCVINGNINI